MVPVLRKLAFSPDSVYPTRWTTEAPCPLWRTRVTHRAHAKPSECLDCVHQRGFVVEPAQLASAYPPQRVHNPQAVLCAAPPDAADG